VLETLPPGPELAMAYSNLAQLRMLAGDNVGAIAWGERAIELAEALGETETLVHALINVGSARLNDADDRGQADLERALGLAIETGFADQAGRTLTNIAWGAIFAKRLDEAENRLAAAIADAIEHDLENYRGYLLASRALVLAHRGAWDDAMTETRQILRAVVVSPLTRIVALTTLGQILVRRGDPEAADTLDEALVLADYTGQLMRIGPVRAARAELALLAGDRERARAEAEAIRDLALSRGTRWQRGEIAYLLWRCGERDIPTDDLAEPSAQQIAGDWAAAAAAWEALGCPYEAACALLEGDEPDALRRALATFEQLEARPAIALTLHRLRTLGVRDLPAVRRGPRPSTQANPSGLTQREAEVLTLFAEGLRNAEIAARLYVTPKTVSHHVSAIFAKLGVETRTEAAARAAQLGITVLQSG
jgi:ATP/maltotriose-dependent transcriptional regulator MalT